MVSQKWIDNYLANGPKWLPHNPDDGWQDSQRYTCREHREVHPFTALNPCYECCYDSYRNPPCPPDIERPNYWRECTLPTIDWPPKPEPYSIGTLLPLLDHTRPAGPGLHCEYHDRYFALDEACATCLKEDEETENA